MTGPVLALMLGGERGGGRVDEQTEEFLAEVLPRFEEAEVDLHNGDATKRIAMWSHHEPVSLFGAFMSELGWANLEPAFGRLADSFADCTAYRNEVVAARAVGDLGYVVAREHTTASIDGRPPAPYVLRVTTIYCREDGEWKIVHRHGDALTDQDD